MNKLFTNINIKTENLNGDLCIKVKEEFNVTTEPQSEYNPVQATVNKDCIKIKSEVSNTHNDNCHDTVLGNIDEKIDPLECNKNADEIKIEKEIISEYIAPIPTTPPHLLCDLILTNIQRPEQRIGPPFCCEFCGHSLPTKNAFYKHIQRKHKYEKGYQRDPLPSPLQCSFCSKVFGKMGSLKLHMDEKHSKKSFVCEHCGHTLPTKNALCQHRLRKHPDVKKDHKRVYKYKCSLCTESFTTADSLNFHKKRVHMKKPVITEGKTWFPCEDCGHKLPTKNALCQHRLRKHRNKKVTKWKIETVLPSSYERLGSHLVESHEVLPALKQMVERF